MVSGSVAVLVTLLAAGGVLTALLFAVSRRRLRQVHRGFLVTLMLALAGTGLGVAAVVGVWAYTEGRDALLNQITVELEHLAGILENEIKEDITGAQNQLQFFAKQLTDDARRTPAGVRERLVLLQAYDPRFLQITLMDAEGKILVSSSVGDAPEPPNRVGVAYNLEGKPFVSDVYMSAVFKRWVLYMSAPVRDAGGASVGAVGARFDMQEDLKAFARIARFGQTGYTAVVNGEGRVVGHPDDKRVNDDVSSYPAVQAALRGKTATSVTVNLIGTEMLMVGRPFQSPATIHPKPWVLLAERELVEALAPIRALRLKFALAAVAAALACLAVAGVLSRAVTRPLHDLLDTVQQVRAGDLSAHTAVTGRDEIGHFGEAFNEMVKGLQDRDRIKEIFGRYVTTQVSQEILSKQVTLGGERRRVTMLISDIRNFTSMSEAMTPEQIITFLNDYFTEMVDAVFEHHGVLDKFLGDGMLAVFGSLDEGAGHERRAVLSALRMKALLAKVNGERSIVGKPPIAIGIGIHTDEVIVGNIGSRKRLEYTVIGDGVNTCSRVEGLNKEFGTTILITDSTYAAIRDEFECREMPEAQLKGKTHVPRVYEVTSAKAAR
ncbi:MAG: adenylate/guanylate cyclase domain-containing protein [Candidatus Rokuibacteriota bacterium]